MSRLRLTHWSVTVDLVFPRKESNQVFFRPLRARSVPLSHLHNCPISDALSEIPDLIANHDISLSSVRRSRRWGPERDRCFTHGIRLKERDGLAIKQPFHYFFLRNLKIKESITSSLQTGEFGKGFQTSALNVFSPPVQGTFVWNFCVAIGPSLFNPW